jgi:DNA-binding response OmpR family regulator
LFQTDKFLPFFHVKLRLVEKHAGVERGPGKVLEIEMRILAVDDDPIILELLSKFIKSIGSHELVTAQSAMEALDLINQAETVIFDCFLLDIQMPVTDGVELTRNIRDIKRYVETPILMLTAMSDKSYVDAAFSAGATDYVTKPFEVTELTARLRLVEELVSVRQSRRKKPLASVDPSTKTQHGMDFGWVELHDPVSIYDVENVIEYTAMENYVRQLARGSMFGSTAFALSIRKVDDHHRALSAAEFSFLISDVAEMISDTLAGHQFLMSYAGSGTFICVTESGWRPDMGALMDAVNLSLARAKIYDNSGQELFVRLSAGNAVRLIWKSQRTVMEALSTAHLSAEAASMAHERSMNDLWRGPQSA